MTNTGVGVTSEVKQAGITTSKAESGGGASTDIVQGVDETSVVESQAERHPRPDRDAARHPNCLKETKHSSWQVGRVGEQPSDWYWIRNGLRDWNWIRNGLQTGTGSGTGT